MWNELLFKKYLYCAHEDNFCLFINPLVWAISREPLACQLIYDYCQTVKELRDKDRSLELFIGIRNSA